MWRHVCLRNLFPPFLLGISIIQSLPEAWGYWEWQQAPPALHLGCIMPIPSLQLQKECCLLHRSRGLGHGVVVSKSCYNTVIVLSVVLSDCCKPMNNCRDWAFSISGLEVWLQAFQLPMFAKCDTPEGNTFRSEICSTSLFNASIPAILFGNFRHPLAARSFMFLRAAAHSTSSAFCLHYACKRSHHFVEDSGFISQAESIGLVTELWSPSFVTEYWNVFFLFAMSTMEMCRDWAFSISGLEVWLQAFQLPMIAKCEAVPNEICRTCLFQEFISVIPLGMSPPALHYCIMPIPSLQLQKKTCLMRRSRGVGHRVVVSKKCYNVMIVLLCDSCNLSF